MARIDQSENLILTWVITRLRSELGLDERTCYASVEPLAPLIPKSGAWFVAVSPEAGYFVPGEQKVLSADWQGGNTTETVQLVVTIYTRMALDSTDHADKRLLDATRGMLERKQQVLAALVGWDLQTTSGHEMLRSLMYATRSSKPAIVRSDESGIVLGLLQISFEAVFDWNTKEVDDIPGLGTMTEAQLGTFNESELSILLE